MKYLQLLYARIKSLLNKNMLVLAVDSKNKNAVTFKNGSIIQCSKIESNDAIRGRRSKLPMIYDDFVYDKEELNKILKEYSSK